MSKLIKPKNNFTTVTNNIVNDTHLTLKAKGLYLFLLSKPDNWNFSARLIATQNKDAIASVNTGLQELEDVGLLSRLPIQGGYDYEIFDTFQSHLVENRLSGKSTKRQPKIHLVEIRPSISNKEFQANEEERELIITDLLPTSYVSFSPSHKLDIYDRLNSLYPDFDLFLSYALRSTKKVHSPVMFKASIFDAFNNPAHKNHDKTIFAYSEWVKMGYPQNNQVLPTGTNIFDLIGRE
ncbi:MAG: hypothetical protein NT103_07570 [Campylobacterales bacterium]|nr:hypothetical protein [Campylobacterales bacterium]